MARPTRARAAALEAAKAAPKFDDRVIDFELDARDCMLNVGYKKFGSRRALFRFKDGKYSDGSKSFGGEGGLESREKAAIKTVAEWYVLTSWAPGTKLEVLLDQPPEPPKPREDGTISYLTDHFDDAFIDLMKDSPNNPLIRGYVMKKLKVMPEASLDTFEKLKEWIEKTFPIPERRVVLKKGRARSASNGSPILSIKFDYNDTERGECRYRVDRYGDRVVEFSLDDIREMIEDGCDRQELVDRFVSIASDEWPDMEWSEDGPDYNDHQTHDHDESSTSPAHGEKATVDTIVEFLNQFEPDLVTQLDNNS